MTKRRTAFASKLPRPERLAASGRGLRQALMRGTILAGAGATAAIGGAFETAAQESNFYDSCVNPAFCSDLPDANWLWDGPTEFTSSEAPATFSEASWLGFDALGMQSPAYPFPNDPTAVVVFPNGVFANVDQPLQAYSWTFSNFSNESIIGGEFNSLQFSEGGGIFSSSAGLELQGFQISGAGGVYLFPAEQTTDGFEYSPLNIRYDLAIFDTYNTYTGPTQITGATLYVAGGASIGDLSAVTIQNTPEIPGVSFAQDGQLVVEQRETVGSLAGVGSVDLGEGLTTGGNDLSTTYAGRITGQGALIKEGTGTFTLTGANTYRGGTHVAAGTLVGSADSIPGAIANGATVVFDQAADATFGGNVTGLNGVDGQMLKQGAGVLTLTGTSTLDWSVAAGGLVSASDRFSGDLALAAGTSFTFDQTYAGTYAGEISGAGDVAFLGGGVVTLTGHSTDHSGTSTVSGHLSVNGTHAGQVAVASGGTLSGNGATGNITVAAGGTVAPGNSIGTLAVNSDLTLAAGSRYRVEVAGDGRSDHLDVLGTATLNGADLDLVLDVSDSYRHGRSYDILQAGAVVGRFAPVDLGSAFLQAELAYSGTDVTLNLAPLAAAGAPLFATVAESANQHAAATALDALDQTMGSASLSLYNAILFSDAATARSALDALSGEVHASVKTGLVEDSRHVRDAMADRLSGRFGPADTGASTSGPSEKMAPVGTAGTEAWTSAYGSWGGTAGNGNAASLGRDAGGVLFGLDAPVAETTRFGVLAGYGNTSLDLAGRSSSASIDSYHLGLYGGGALGPIDLKTGAAYRWNEIKTARSVSLPAFSDSPDARYEADTIQLFGEVSSRFDLGQTRIEPFANLAYVSLDTDGFRETGGAAALAASRTTDAVTFSNLGLRSETELAAGSLGLSAKTLLGWRRAYGDTTPEAALRFAGGDAFAIGGASIDEDAAVVELGLALAVSPQASFGLHYAGQFGESATDNGVSAKLGIEF